MQSYKLINTHIALIHSAAFNSKDTKMISKVILKSLSSFNRSIKDNVKQNCLVMSSLNTLLARLVHRMAIAKLIYYERMNNTRVFSFEQNYMS
jgi:hypothetical protein